MPNVLFLSLAETSRTTRAVGTRTRPIGDDPHHAIAEPVPEIGAVIDSKEVDPPPTIAEPTPEAGPTIDDPVLVADPTPADDPTRPVNGTGDPTRRTKDDPTHAVTPAEADPGVLTRPAPTLGCLGWMDRLIPMMMRDEAMMEETPGMEGIRETGGTQAMEETQETGEIRLVN